MKGSDHLVAEARHAGLAIARQGRRYLIGARTKKGTAIVSVYDTGAIYYRETDRHAVRRMSVSDAKRTLGL